MTQSLQHEHLSSQQSVRGGAVGNGMCGTLCTSAGDQCFAHLTPRLLQGFAKTRSEKAVFHTHNCGVEPALQWLIEHEDDANIDTPEDFAV